jgi:hypothetical protein
MELPDDVLAQIKEYAQPVTRPGWRKLHIMSNQRFYMELMKLKEEWWRRDKLIYRRRPLPYDKLMRKYIMRYRIHLLAEFEWDSKLNI